MKLKKYDIVKMIESVDGFQATENGIVEIAHARLYTVYFPEKSVKDGDVFRWGCTNESLVKVGEIEVGEKAVVWKKYDDAQIGMEGEIASMKKEEELGIDFGYVFDGAHALDNLSEATGQWVPVAHLRFPLMKQDVSYLEEMKPSKLPSISEYQSLLGL